MKKFTPLLAAAFVGLAAPRIVLAQNVYAPQNAVFNAAPPKDAKWHMVRIRNVRPSFLAWSLDPAHNTTPLEMRVSPPAMGTLRFPLAYQPVFAEMKSRLGNPLDLPANYRLPAGVMLLAPTDAQNILNVYGTQEGVLALQNDLKAYDKPVRQVEVSAQLVQVEFGDLKGLTLSPFMEDGKAKKNQFHVEGDLKEELQKLVDAKKAVVKIAPRVLAVNTLTASIATSMATPVEIGMRTSAQDRKEGDKTFPTAVTFNQGGLYLTKSLRFSATPAINADGTITALISPEATLGLSNGDETGNAPDALQLPNVEGLQELVHLKDGETIALRGLTTRYFDYNPLLKAPEKTSEVIVFVTARIVKRWDE